MKVEVTQPWCSLVPEQERASEPVFKASEINFLVQPPVDAYQLGFLVSTNIKPKAHSRSGLSLGLADMTHQYDVIIIIIIMFCMFVSLFVSNFHLRPTAVELKSLHGVGCVSNRTLLTH